MIFGKTILRISVKVSTCYIVNELLDADLFGRTYVVNVMGMQLVGGGPSSAFLSSRPTEESHEIVFFANPAGKHTETMPAVFQQDFHIRRFPYAFCDAGRGHSAVVFG